MLVKFFQNGAAASGKKCFCKLKRLHGPWLKGILAPVARQRNILARIPGNTGRINCGVQTRRRQGSDSWHRGSLLVIKFFQNGAAASGKKFFGKFKPHLTGLGSMALLRLAQNQAAVHLCHQTFKNK